MSYENRKTKFNLYVFLFLKQVVKKTKGSSKKVLKDITTSEDEEMTKTNTKKVESNDHPVIPDAIRFDPSKSLENKPKGLVDSLTKYFTPGHKRTSRTALNSLIKPAVELQTPSPTNKRRKQEKVFSSSGKFMKNLYFPKLRSLKKISQISHSHEFLKLKKYKLQD